MAYTQKVATKSVRPALRYRDLPRAIEWLGRAFAFEVKYIGSPEGGVISYAEMSYGDSVVLLGAVDGSLSSLVMKQPDEVGGAETQTCYVIVDDLMGHRVRALDAGADILFDIDHNAADQSYTCRDPEGHIWTFGVPLGQFGAAAAPKLTAKGRTAFLSSLFVGICVVVLAVLALQLLTLLPNSGTFAAVTDPAVAMLQEANARQASQGDVDHFGRQTDVCVATSATEKEKLAQALATCNVALDKERSTLAEADQRSAVLGVEKAEDEARRSAAEHDVERTKAAALEKNVAEKGAALKAAHTELALLRDKMDSLESQLRLEETLRQEAEGKAKQLSVAAADRADGVAEIDTKANCVPRLPAVQPTVLPPSKHEQTEIPKRAAPQTPAARPMPVVPSKARPEATYSPNTLSVSRVIAAKPPQQSNNVMEQSDSPALESELKFRLRQRVP